MKLKSKYLLFIVTILLTKFNIVFAGCDHCYTCAKVNIIYSNQINESAYLKIYGLYQINISNDYINRDIYNTITKYKNSIEITDTLYQIEKLPAFAIQERIKTIDVNEINQIVLLKWTNINGAGNFPSLSQNVAQNMLEKENLKYYTIEQETSTDYLINTSKSLTDENFSYIILNSHKLNYSKFSISSFLKTKIINSSTSKTYDNDALYLKSLISEFIQKLSITIFEYKQVEINESIDDYFCTYSNNLEKNKEFFEILNEYLTTKKSDKLKNYIFKNVKNESRKKYYIKRIIDCKTDNDIKKLIYYFLRSNGVMDINKSLNEKFDKMFIENNLTILNSAWD